MSDQFTEVTTEGWLQRLGGSLVAALIGLILVPASIAEISLSNPRVPILHVRNSCDIGGICPNGDTMAKQLRAIGNDVQDVILDSAENQVEQCEAACGANPLGGGSIGFWGELRGIKNHVAWPKQWNDRIFEFLQRHPLGPTS